VSRATVRVLVADDHPVVREGLTAILHRFPDLEVVASVGDGGRAVDEACRLRPHVVLCDLRMPGTDGVEVARRLRARLPDTAVLMLSTFDDSPGILAALSVGARGYLLKDAAPEDLRRAILACARGDTVLHPHVAGKVARVRGTDAGWDGPGDPRGGEAPVGAGGPAPLTGREIEVLALLAQGLANKEIAAALRVGESTVKTHVGNVFRKLGAVDRVQAVTEGMRRGYLDPPVGGFA
jgi:two-component system response regulator DegU